MCESEFTKYRWVCCNCQREWTTSTNTPETECPACGCRFLNGEELE